MLDDLLDVLTEDHLPLRRSDDLWDVATHLGHLATSDPPLTAMLEDLSADLVPARVLAAVPFLGERDAQIASSSLLSLDALRARLVESRRQLRASLARLDPRALESHLLFSDASGATVGVPVRSYLAAWAAHDEEHITAIRAAIATVPSPAALAVAARLRPKRELPH